MRQSKIGFHLINQLQEKAGSKEPKDLVQGYTRNSVARPGTVPQRELLILEVAALEVIDKYFETIELSPVTVLGTNSVLAGISQKTVLSTVRDWEVLADPTTSLALESAQRRSEHLVSSSRDTTVVRLASSARILRLQDFSSRPGFNSHFKAIGLVSAGRDTGSRSFELEEFVRHLSAHLEFLTTPLQGLWVQNVCVYLSDTRILQSVLRISGTDLSDVARAARAGGFSAFDELGISLPKLIESPAGLSSDEIGRYALSAVLHELQIYWDSVIVPLKESFPAVTFRIQLDRAAGANYYYGPCFKIRADTAQGYTYPLVDGGMVRWSQMLVGSKKERMLSSGLGIELLCTQFAHLRNPLVT